MRFFGQIYEKVIVGSKHKHAPFYLALISFIEPSLFGIPPGMLLVPMSLSKPQYVWRYTNLVIFFGLLGALFGYCIGWFFFDLAHRWLDYAGYMSAYDRVQVWFGKWGGWIMFASGLLPVPFHLFTIGAGVLHLALLPFTLGALVSRTIRFYLVASVLYWQGARIDNWLRRFIERIGWAIIIILIGVGSYKLVKHYINGTTTHKSSVEQLTVTGQAKG